MARHNSIWILPIGGDDDRMDWVMMFPTEAAARSSREAQNFKIIKVIEIGGTYYIGSNARYNYDLKDGETVLFKAKQAYFGA